MKRISVHLLAHLCERGRIALFDASTATPWCLDVPHGHIAASADVEIRSATECVHLHSFKVPPGRRFTLIASDGPHGSRTRKRT